MSFEDAKMQKPVEIMNAMFSAQIDIYIVVDFSGILTASYSGS